MQTERQTDRQIERQADRKTDRYADRKTDRQADRQADRQKDKETRPADRHAEWVFKIRKRPSDIERSLYFFFRCWAENGPGQVCSPPKTSEVHDMSEKSPWSLLEVSNCQFEHVTHADPAIPGVTPVAGMS
ncbi:glycosyl transferase [Elysia marginata]|uniref:Glycosyl transferase n=1 Tax=Elysia marginata TaxID=1093978 RepID=A0AAV4HZG7_9GAST|nr:glycosyl transferase [Elysia marginata]